MFIYQDLNNSEKTAIRGLFMLLFTVITFFALIYAFYYGVLGLQAWRDLGMADKFQITVSGEGSVFAVPDIAEISVGVKSQGKTLNEAQADNTAKYNSIVDFIKSNGIEQKDIKTTYYNVNPQYQYNNRPCPLIGGSYYPCPPAEAPKIVGYEITSSLSIKVRNMNRVGDILDGVVSAGANEVNGPTFSIDDESVLKEKAKKVAIDNAKESAKKLSRDLGVKLHKIVGFSESGGYPPIYFARAMEAKDANSAFAAPSIEPGQNEIKVNVIITYEVR